MYIYGCVYMRVCMYVYIHTYIYLEEKKNCVGDWKTKYYNSYCTASIHLYCYIYEQYVQLIQ